MPEMADVEVLKRRFNEELKGETISGVTVLNPALVKGVTSLEKKLTDKKIREASRYGKYLFVKIGAEGYLILHFGLTGHLIFETDKEKKIPSSAMMVISTDKFNLIYEAFRVFGMASWCNDPQDFIKEKKLGPDAAEISESEFVNRLRSVKGAVKPALMDQHKVAGVGNVYADEILFQAGVPPQAPAQSLTPTHLKKLYRQIHRVHDSAVKVGAVRTQMPPWAIMKIRKTTRICPKCKGKLKNTLLNRRETLFCPNCQRL
jgi:formamidopyrimidine-DNA glycosylase